MIFGITQNLKLTNVRELFKYNKPTMAFQLGAKFSSFEEVKEALRNFQKEKI